MSRQVTLQPRPPSITRVARNSAGGVEIGWTAADSLSDLFQVERLDSGGWTVVGSVASQSPPAFTDHPPKFFLGHSYRVCGEGIFGEACSPSAALPSSSTPPSGSGAESERLSPPAGGWTLAAAETVCAPDDLDPGRCRS